MTSVTLLGPQIRQPIVKDVLDEQEIDGPLAVITGGWEEREDEQDVLKAHVARPTVNLSLYRRREEVLRRDRPLSEALGDRNERLRVAQTLYRRRLSSALKVVRSLYRLKVPRMELLPPERAHALQTVADLDTHYREQINDIHMAFDDLWSPLLRPAVAEVRAELFESIKGCAGVLIAGGHVGQLLDQLSLFELGRVFERLQLPIVAWSAGSMVLTEHIVLFHDTPPQGRGDPEIYDEGLSLAPRVVVLPHASARLKLDDRMRVSLLAKRFHPASCVALDEGCGLRWDGRDWTAFGFTRRLRRNGLLAGMVAP